MAMLLVCATCDLLVWFSIRSGTQMPVSGLVLAFLTKDQAGIEIRAFCLPSREAHGRGC